MESDRFDQLARAVGAGRSRRGILKGLGAAALGAVGLQRFGAAEAANGKGNSGCAHFCNQVFGADTSAAGQCTSQGAHGTGPCVACANNPANYCGGACTNVQTDVANCGSCGTVCPSDACHAATCASGVCGTTSTGAGGVGAACTPANFHDGAPIGSPGTGCCGDLVCHGFSAPGQGVCGTNGAPSAVNRDVKHPWNTTCIPVTLVGYDPEGDAIVLEPVTQPQNGFLTSFVAVDRENFGADETPGDGTTGGVRALLAQATDCVPRGPLYIDPQQPGTCPNCICPDCSGRRADGSIQNPPGLVFTGSPGNAPLDYGSTTSKEYGCPEGIYYQRILCYVPYSSTFTGIDSFTYTATDVFGAQSSPAIFSITVFEV
jgi:hypothetical protein